MNKAEAKALAMEGALTTYRKGKAAAVQALKTPNVIAPISVGATLGAMTGYLTSATGGDISPMLVGVGYLATGAAIAATTNGETSARVAESFLTCGSFVLANQAYVQAAAFV